MQSGNGRFAAIDHFRGNAGRESLYRVDADDLSDIKSGFLRNMRRVGLADDVTLLDAHIEEAVAQIQDFRIRFLFIDGDHTYSGVKRDLSLLTPMLTDEAIVVFDDFSASLPGVCKRPTVGGARKLNSFGGEE